MSATLGPLPPLPTQSQSLPSTTRSPWNPIQLLSNRNNKRFTIKLRKRCLPFQFAPGETSYFLTDGTLAFLCSGVDNRGGRAASTSSIVLPVWELSRLPSHVHLLEDLLSRMHENLDRILEEYHAVQAGGTFVMDPVSCRRLIPDFALETLRAHPALCNFRINYERDAESHRQTCVLFGPNHPLRAHGENARVRGQRAHGWQRSDGGR